VARAEKYKKLHGVPVHSGEILGVAFWGLKGPGKAVRRKESRRAETRRKPPKKGGEKPAEKTPPHEGK